MKLETVYIELPGEKLEALRAFYTGPMGLTPTSEEPGESIWFDAGGTQLGFHASDDAHLDPGCVNLSFAVADTDAAAARLQGEGIEITQGPMDAPWNNSRVAVLFDPAGHTVWLTGPPRR